MSNYLVDRGGARANVVTHLKTVSGLADEVNGTVHVYGYVPKKLQGVSPIVTVSNGPYVPNFQKEERGVVNLLIGVWARRDQDAAEAENMLDTIGRAVLLKIDETYNAESDQESLITSAVMDGVDYRIEFHFVSFQWW